MFAEISHGGVPCRPASLLLHLLVLSLPWRAPAPDSDYCRNALFEAHWFVRDGSPQTLAYKPVGHTDLRLCPADNGRPSCCQKSFEVEQQLHFDFWNQIFTTKLKRVRNNKVATMSLESKDIYNAASPEDLQQYHRAIQAYEAVLDPAGHSRCLAALMTYVAGMMCFACDPEWADQVQVGMGAIIRVRISEGTCTNLWEACGHFSALTQALKQAVLDSSLAVQQPGSLENLAMFADQQALCDWAHDAIAMHPFTTPGESEREATPPAAAMSGRRLLLQGEEPPFAGFLDRRLDSGSDPGSESDSGSDSGSAGPGAEGGEANPSKEETEELRRRWKDFDAIKAGRASGFDITWGGVVGTGAASPRRRPSLHWAASFLVALCCWAASPERGAGRGGGRAVAAGS